MKLLIDIGNSRLKWATLEQGAFAHSGVVPRSGASTQAALLEGFRELSRPAAILVANVGGEAAATDVVAACRQSWSLTPEFAEVERERLGVTNGYADFRRLGVDRWLGLIAAWAGHQRPACIVDCGTATTIDGLDRDGQHVGGLIVPGLELLQRSLAENTSGIPPAGGAPAVPGFGRSTEECVRNGAATAQAALIDRAAGWMSERYGGNLRRIITGGAADSILPHVQQPFERDPELVLRGLALLVGDH